MLTLLGRRSLTVRAHETFHFPWGCDGCGLQTVAHVAAEGIGSASSLDIQDSGDRAQSAAAIAAHGNAIKILGVCPCPRCGLPALMHRQNLIAWEHRSLKSQMARRVILVGGVTLSFLSSAGCGVVMGLGQTKGDRLGVGVMSALSWLVICFVGTLILYGLAGPGRAPLAPGSVPQGVTFDPPRSAPSHAPPASVASPAPDSWCPPPTRTGSPLYGQR